MSSRYTSTRGPGGRRLRDWTYRVTLTVTDNEGCAATSVYIGQTAHCNATDAAVATRTVTVQAAGQAPTAPDGADGDDQQPDEGEDGDGVPATETWRAPPHAAQATVGFPSPGSPLGALLLAGATLLTVGIALRHLSHQRPRPPGPAHTPDTR